MDSVSTVDANMLQKTKMLLRRAIANTYYATGHYLTMLKGKVVILTYHRVLSDAELNESYVQPGMYVHKDVFEEHVKFLKSRFIVLSFQELLELWEGNAIEGDTRYCVITFDDGWLDNYTYAYPVLNKYQLPATIFLATSFIGSDEWFWPERIFYFLSRNESNSGVRNILNKFGIHGSDTDEIIEGCKALRDAALINMIDELEAGSALPKKRKLLNWDEVKEMSKNNITFGSHTSNHKILTNIPIAEVRTELVNSKQTLEEKGVCPIPVFCYPNGDFNEEIVAEVKSAGYKAAVSTKFGYEGLNSNNLFALKRIGIHNDMSKTKPLFVSRISGFK